MPLKALLIRPQCDSLLGEAGLELVMLDFARRGEALVEALRDCAVRGDEIGGIWSMMGRVCRGESCRGFCRGDGACRGEGSCNELDAE